MAVRIMIKDEAFEMANTLALVFAINHWQEFAKEMRLDNGPDGEDAVKDMYDELCHHTARMLYTNEAVLKTLFVQWGDEKVAEFISRLTAHKH